MNGLRKILYRTKASLKRQSTWAVVITVILIAVVFTGITLPDQDNTMIGIVTSGSSCAVKILDDLNDGEHIYGFSEYEDEDALTADILSGKIECGFIFDEKFDNLFETGRLKKGITYINSPYTTKGSVAKEVIYGAFLREYSINILKNDAESIFVIPDDQTREEITKALKEKNDYYMDSSEVFSLAFIEEE